MKKLMGFLLLILPASFAQAGQHSGIGPSSSPFGPIRGPADPIPDDDSDGGDEMRMEMGWEAITGKVPSKRNGKGLVKSGNQGQTPEHRNLPQGPR